MENRDKIRVLVIDDSVVMRHAISKLINCDDIEVIETACNGKEGVEKAISLHPDVITMDIEMPVMNGIEALREIMHNQPIPVIMVSTLTTEGADATLEALSIGAVDFITKRAALREIDSMKDELISKIISIGKNNNLKNQLIRKRLLRKIKSERKELISEIEPHERKEDNNFKNLKNRTRPNFKDISVIIIGISTGGPNALHELLTKLPENLTSPILIAQHMPPYFTKSLAQRLNSFCKLNVKEAEDNEYVRAGFVYIAPGGKQMKLTRHNKIEIIEEYEEQLYHPSVDVLLNSAINSVGNNTLAIMMTGMGNDGSTAMKHLSDIGGYILVQDPETCIVSGMVGAEIKLGAADEILSINGIADAIINISSN